MRALPGADGADETDLVWTTTGMPFPSLNPVADARFAAADADARIAAVVARSRARGVPLQWYAGPTTRPEDLGQRLLAHGFEHDSDDPGMAIDLHTLPEPTPLDPQVVIARVRDRAALQSWWHVAAGGFDFPAAAQTMMDPFMAAIDLSADAPLAFYLATVEGTPAACSMRMLGGGVAGIYSVATLPPFRRRGLGAAITCAPLL